MLRHLRTLRLLNNYSPSVSATIEWTDKDRKVLSDLDSTDTGKKLAHVINSHITQSALQACGDKQGDRYDCGIAQGIRIAYATLASLKFRQPAADAGTPGDDSGIPAELSQ